MRVGCRCGRLQKAECMGRLKGVWIGLQRLCSGEKESVFSVSLVYSRGAKQLRTPSLEEMSCLAGDGPVKRDFAKGLEVMHLRSGNGQICQ